MTQFPGDNANEQMEAQVLYLQAPTLKLVFCALLHANYHSAHTGLSVTEWT
jgi:hypothetical protein